MYNKPTAIAFGSGNMFKLNLDIINEHFNLIAVADNNKSKWGTIIEGVQVISPDMLKDYEYDYILISTGREISLDIKKQLLSMGIPVSKMRFSASSGTDPFMINPQFFRSDLCLEDKKRLFSENMERVILELNSMCNRKCWFCTNAYVCNNKENIDMSDDVFYKVLSELKEVNYKYDICLSFFNEPLLCTNLENRISEIKKYLPESNVYAYTNGDYLDMNKMESLAQAGLDMLIVDIYSKEMKYNKDTILKEITVLGNKLNIQVVEMDNSIQGKTVFNNMIVDLRAKDFTVIASNRAESLPEDLPYPKLTNRPKPCIKNFFSMHIDFRGDLWPCPNYHREYEKHRKYCLGNVKDNTIFDIYIGDKMNEYREENLFHRDRLPCRSCIQNFETFIENEFYKPFRDRPGVK